LTSWTPKTNRSRAPDKKPAWQQALANARLPLYDVADGVLLGVSAQKLAPLRGRQDNSDVGVSGDMKNGGVADR
jgi:hypothetical protein